MSVRIPSGSPIEQTWFIKVDLAGIPTDTLQMIQVQVQEELRDREVATYQQNEKLAKENDQLQERNKSISTKLTQKEYEESQLKQMIEDLCVELPQCNISMEASMSQKVNIIVAKE